MRTEKEIKTTLEMWHRVRNDELNLPEFNEHCRIIINCLEWVLEIGE